MLLVAALRSSIKKIPALSRAVTMGRNSSQQLRKKFTGFVSPHYQEIFVVGHKFLVGENPLSSLYHIFNSQVFLPHFSEPHVTVMWCSLTCIPKIGAFFNGLDN